MQQSCITPLLTDVSSVSSPSALITIYCFVHNSFINLLTFQSITKFSIILMNSFQFTLPQAFPSLQNLCKLPIYCQWLFNYHTLVLIYPIASLVPLPFLKLNWLSLRLASIIFLIVFCIILVTAFVIRVMKLNCYKISQFLA